MASKHVIKHRKFGRMRDERRALLRALATSLCQHGRIETTLPKAKDLRPIVEKLVTKAITGGLTNIRAIAAFLYTDEARKQLFETAQKIGSRPGGYLRILKTGFRPSDKAPKAIIEFVDLDFTKEAK